MKTVTLFRHQDHGVDKGLEILSKYHGLGIFFDPGLGKTLTILTIADTFMKEGEITHLIVVCPKTLYGTWQDEIARHTYFRWAFQWETKKSQKYLATLADADKNSEVILTNYEAYREVDSSLSKLLEKLSGRALVVFDESTRIKTPSSQQSKGVRKIFKDFKYRVIMTGTEITKSPLDLWAQFDALKSGFWQIPFGHFRNRYAIMTDLYLPGGKMTKKVSGFQKINELQAIIEPMVVRAKKKDCLDLPDKIFQNIPVELSAAEWKVYQDLKTKLMTILENGEIISVQQKIALFTRFRTITGGWADTINQITNRPSKLSTLIDMVADDESQAIIWCSFTHEIRMLQKELSQYGKCVTYTGEDSQEERVGNFSQFVTGGARFFLGNAKTAGFGLNLQNCPLQYFYSLPTSAEEFMQALDRSHRIGSTSNVVYRFLLGRRNGTPSIDWRIKALLEQSVDLLQAFQTRELRELVTFI